MPQSRKELCLTAAAQAMRARKQASYGLHTPVNVFDLCARLGVSVFFQDIPSMEGIYMPDARPHPAIVISSLRPPGRKAITCGHELGHHLFKHGRQWDELIEERNEARRFDPDEFLVDVFSACLQMPKNAVSRAMTNRSLDAEKCRAEDIFAMSTYFGVSYGAFVTHLESTLNFIGTKRASELAARKPKDLRESLLCEPCPQGLVVVDLKWEERAIDVESGDSLLFPPGITLEGDCAQVRTSTNSRVILDAITPGIARVNHPSDWSAYIRVMRKDYVGRAPFRFDQEADDDV